MASIILYKDNIGIGAQLWEYESIKLIPAVMWNKEHRIWVVPNTIPAMKTLQQEVVFDQITPRALAHIEKVLTTKSTKPIFPRDYVFAEAHGDDGELIEPKPYQIEALDAAWGTNEFAFFMWMGLGKTYVDINHTCCLMQHQKINANLIICPTPIKPVWEKQLSKFVTVDANIYVLEAGKQKQCLEWMNNGSHNMFLVVGIEALSQGTAKDIAKKFTQLYQCKVTVDESTGIKTPGTNRTQRVIGLGSGASYRTLLNGTPITQGMEDLYAQFKFLNWEILGYRTVAEFYAAHVKTIQLNEFTKVVGYRQVPLLLEKVRSYCFVLKTEDVYSQIPPKVYEQRYIKPSLSQIKAMKDLDAEMQAWDEDETITVRSALERMTRYQQITGGFFPYKDENNLNQVKPISGKNPKLVEMMSFIETLPEEKKSIIWARFRPEIDTIVKAIQKKYGHESVVEFHGGLDKEARAESNRRFQEDPGVRFIVSNQQTGARGQTWTAASYCLYFSNTFSYDDREQSESRPWGRVSKIENRVVFVDFILDHKNDRMITTAIARKEDVASMVANQLRKR